MWTSLKYNKILHFSICNIMKTVNYKGLPTGGLVSQTCVLHGCTVHLLIPAILTLVGQRGSRIPCYLQGHHSLAITWTAFSKNRYPEKETSVHILCVGALKRIRNKTLGRARMEADQIKEKSLSGVVAVDVERPARLNKEIVSNGTASALGTWKGNWKGSS